MYYIYKGDKAFQERQLQKAINNVRFVRKELYYKIADYTGVIV